MSDKNRKDGEFSLPDMREMFEHYTSVEDDEPAAQRSEMEDLARRYLDCGDDETGVESRQESGAVTEEKEPVSEPDEAEPSVIHVTPHETEQPEEEPEPDVPTEQPKALQDGVYNILICGTDDDGTRTDTIIIAHLDANDHTVALLSIPRDTPVATGGGGLMKINSVYAGGGKDGMERLAARLKDLLGFPVDGYVLVDLEAFQKTVDLVGGVEFDVPMDMNYEDPSQNLYIHLQKGLQTLDGEQAMGLVRFRKGYATQDIQRTQTQQQFLKALAKQCLSVSSLTKLREFADIFSQYVTTNLTTGNMVWFGKELLSCDFDNMKTYTAEGEGAMINGASYYPLYAGKLLSVVNEAFNPYDTPISAGSLTVITPELAYSYQKQADPAPEIPETPETTEAPDETPDLPTEDPAEGPADPVQPEQPLPDDPFAGDALWEDTDPEE